jgi:peptide/nickel transport system ATP-binding protein
MPTTRQQSDSATVSTSVPVTHTTTLTSELSTLAKRVSTLGMEANAGFVRRERETRGWTCVAIQPCAAPFTGICFVRAAPKDLMPTLLAVKSLRVRYRSPELGQQHAVENASFDISAGEVLGLMGESGCGKTSIALALLGLLSKEQAHVSGSVQFLGKELLTMGQGALRAIRGAGISMVFQEPGIALSPVMRVRDQVAEVLYAHTSSKWKECCVDAELALARVGLANTQRLFSAYPHQLSGGQQQRVVLAQALACKPALVIADEPTASLDARSQDELLALLRKLQRELRISILLISHSAEVQARLADRLMVMDHGRIVEQGRFEDLYRNPSYPCTRAMLRTTTAAIVAENVDFEMVT